MCASSSAPRPPTPRWHRFISRSASSVVAVIVLTLHSSGVPEAAPAQFEMLATKPSNSSPLTISNLRRCVVLVASLNEWSSSRHASSSVSMSSSSIQSLTIFLFNSASFMSNTPFQARPNSGLHPLLSSLGPDEFSVRTHGCTLPSFAPNCRRRGAAVKADRKRGFPGHLSNSPRHTIRECQVVRHPHQCAVVSSNSTFQPTPSCSRTLRANRRAGVRSHAAPSPLL